MQKRLGKSLDLHLLGMPLPPVMKLCLPLILASWLGQIPTDHFPPLPCQTPASLPLVQTPRGMYEAPTVPMGSTLGIQAQKSQKGSWGRASVWILSILKATFSSVQPFGGHMSGRTGQYKFPLCTNCLFLHTYTPLSVLHPGKQDSFGEFKGTFKLGKDTKAISETMPARCGSRVCVNRG